MPSSLTTHDVLIAGGGMAGASLALGLSQLGLDVGVIEAVARNADHQPSYDDRTLVLNRVSLRILTRLGIVDHRLARCPIRTIRVTRAGGFGQVLLHARDHQVDAFGEVVVARELGNRLLAEVQANPGITEYCPERLETFEADDQNVQVRLGSGRKLNTRLLVAADGTGSAVRQAAGIVSTLHDYRQSAMIFNVLPGRASSDTAHERFTRNGPLAFLPQPEGRFGVVWIDQTDAIESALEWTDDELLTRLHERAGPGFGGFSKPGKRARYPLKLLRTEVPIGQRVVAIGNAANTMHPVSAQGLNLGLRDVAGLVDVLREVKDPGAPAWMARYVKQRKADQAETVRYTDTLARVFSNPNPLIRLGAGLGLSAHALLPGLKKRLVYSAMGFRSPVSTLAKAATNPATRRQEQVHG